MFFVTLKERMEYMRSMTDYCLMPNTYVMVMLDGRGFSNLIKNKFKRPFDDNFIGMMNETAKYLCEKVENCRFAYVQSDEISLFLDDSVKNETDSFFGYRLTKLLSIIPSMASGKFNQLMTCYKLSEHFSNEGKLSAVDIVKDMKLAEFDCKAWNLPKKEDIYSWFLYRQNDCTRNSKQQTANTYYSHNEMFGMNTDVLVKKLLEEKNVDWNAFEDGKKYGRFIYKEMKEISSQNGITYRNKFLVHNAFPLFTEEGKNKFYEIAFNED